MEINKYSYSSVAKTGFSNVKKQSNKQFGSILHEMQCACEINLFAFSIFLCECVLF